MLGAKPKNSEKLKEWILSLQKEEGGFGGSIEMESEMLFFLYCIMGLIII